MAIICHCELVSDKKVKAVIADGAQSIDDIAARCGAGANCGGCWEGLSALLMETERAPGCRGGGATLFPTTRRGHRLAVHDW